MAICDPEPLSHLFARVWVEAHNRRPNVTSALECPDRFLCRLRAGSDIGSPEGTGTLPVTFGVVALLLGLTALAASLVPAVRAGRVDPSVTLREG